ncbi:MAG TPA: hypothetical protein VMM92_04410 [Thermoanaerobaculia bacterium]|nr:hypothetical protein [Thermoanaerobaculia bacterium]
MLLFDRGLGGDGWASFAALESLVEDADLHLENNLRGVDNGIVPTPSGHLTLQYPPGILLLDLPPFAAGRVLDRLLPVAWLGGGVDLPPVGRVPRQVFLSAAAIVLARNLETLLGLAWLALALRRLGFEERTAVAATALTFFGGPLLFYSLVGMTHAPSFALASLLFLLLVRQRETGGVGGAGGCGVVLGFATLVRYGALGILPAALLGIGLSRAAALPASGGLPKPKLLSAFGAGFLTPLLFLPLYWRAGTGIWRPPGYGGSFQLTPASPWNVLFSPHHGLFWFHPALLLAVLGLAAAARSELPRNVGMGTVALLWLLGVALLNGCWSEWANSGGYGQRFLIDALPALGLGFAQGLPVPRRRLLQAGLAAATLFGYLLFFAAIAGLAPPPPPFPWPQRLSDYRPLLANPPSPQEFWAGCKRASLVLRATTELGSRKLSL